ncbi:MAG: hypothetical protein H6779_05135 [Candidatus Nomurabacteria bacterium]|nr:hypothetical protein [Candidatus Nomurabacteria bacterium]USN87752.1 MAG: hypothetical protein H6779_05135 [Candidatus Nomurabacteria bacterium]
MKCTISTATKTTVIDEIAKVTVPTPSGQIEIRPGHAEYYGATTEGVLVVTDKDSKEGKYSLVSGICAVKKDIITILQ